MGAGGGDVRGFLRTGGAIGTTAARAWAFGLAAVLGLILFGVVFAVNFSLTRT